MAAGASAQMQVAFEDISISFSQEEWEYLNEEQKELYREVMKENYQTLISLGSLTFTPKIISHIERGEEPYIRGEPGSEEREHEKSSCLADYQNRHDWKRIENQGEGPVKMEEIQTQSENVYENISQTPEIINTKNCKQESREQRDPAEDSMDRGPSCERTDRELSHSPENQRPSQINNSDKVTSESHHGKRKRKTHQKELQMHKRGHKNKKPFLSTEHNKSFTRLSTLKIQQQTPTAVKPFICIECNKSFTRLSYLKRHKIVHTGYKPFTCTECNKSFTRLSDLKRHKMIHTGYKPYTCTECNKSFTQLSHLKSHKMIHTGYKPYTCTECNKSFTQLSSLKSHKMIHTGYKPFSCTECNKRFSRLSYLKIHQRIHTGEKPYLCTVCNKNFTHLSDLNFHKKIHMGDKPYNCTECNKNFTQHSCLKRHQRIHTGYKPYTCTECNKSFTRLSTLKSHQQTHIAVKPFICTECNKSFTQLSYLKRHKIIHTGYKPFTCTECNKSFTQLSVLKNHKQTHTAVKPFTCTECNKSFTRLSYLKGHKMIHTGHKPYTCTECNKSFTQLSHLKSHKMIHTGHKPFTCTECNKSFTQLSVLKRHEVIHTGFKPYTCTECNKSFTQLSSLKSHKLIHTGHKPFICTECNKSFSALSGLIPDTGETASCNRRNISSTLPKEGTSERRKVPAALLPLLFGIPKPFHFSYLLHTSRLPDIPQLWSHPLLPAMRKAWKLFCKAIGTTSHITPYLPIVGNGDFLPSLDSTVIRRWSRAGLTYVFQAVQPTGSPLSFGELQEKYHLLSTDWLAYRQLHHYLHALTPLGLCEEIQDNFQEALSLTAQESVPLRFYHKWLQGRAGELDFSSLARKWTVDLQLPISADVLRKGLRAGKTATICAVERDRNYKFLLRAFYTPKRTHTMGLSVGHCCDSISSAHTRLCSLYSKNGASGMEMYITTMALASTPDYLTMESLNATTNAVGTP
uniref:Zinc finger protein 665-like n=1 Tax=Geotrypetes seraphini TaxID=260995 RepID=A0A6P8Q1S1_GEOSA|nr:zinc finger protein 665-like [Geotrypetes seraphini]